MKKFSKFLLIFGAFLFHQTHADDNWFYSITHGGLKIGQHLNGVMAVASAGNYMYTQYNIANSPDASEIVVQFCQERLKAHGLDHDKVKIKVREEGLIVGALGKTYIIFGPFAADELKNALENKDNESAQVIIKIYATLIDHEIGHLKNNDSLKRMAVKSAAVALYYAASLYITDYSPCSSWFAKPTNFKEFCTSLLAYGALSMIGMHGIKSVYSNYAQYQENNADVYAIEHAHDPMALRYTAACVEALDGTIIDFLCGAPAYEGIPAVKRVFMEWMRQMVIVIYQSAEREEDFRSWVMKETELLANFKAIYDPEHPSGFSRAKLMRDAADALEAQQAVA